MRKNILIKIKKEDAMKLNKDYGVRFGENGISKTHGHHKNYFLTESEHNLRSLLNFTSHNEAQQIIDRLDAKKHRRARRRKVQE